MRFSQSKCKERSAAAGPLVLLMERQPIRSGKQVLTFISDGGGGDAVIRPIEIVRSLV